MTFLIVNQEGQEISLSMSHLGFFQVVLSYLFSFKSSVVKLDGSKSLPISLSQE